MLHRATAILVLALLHLGLAACGSSDNPSKTRGDDAAPAERTRPLVVCTTPIVADLLREIGGERIEVVGLIQPGVDPHLWTPTRTDIITILEADAVALNGLMLEGRIGDSIARAESLNRPVLRVAQTISRDDLLTDHRRATYFDPHIWMDPILWGETAAPTAAFLARVAPAHADEFRARAEAFQRSAQELERECRLALAAIPYQSRLLVTAHDAFEYFGRRFDLKVRGIQGLSTESEASIADIEHLVAEISQKQIPSAFIETTVSDRTVRALVEGCKGVGHDLGIGEPLYSDSLGRLGSAEGTWIGMMRYNTRVIAESLTGSGR
ncbi:MAG: hypothetical protein RL136_2179 [Planctomycetota bacterium]|jgi:manganese/zinc/iron transport system substrate-binding protein